MSNNKDESKPRRPKGEGSISKLKNGKYLARVNTKNGRVSKTCDTRPQASKWIKEVIREDENAVVRNGTMLYAYMDNWIHKQKEDLVAKNTEIRFKYTVKKIKEVFEDKEIQELTEDDMRSIIRGLIKKKLSYATIVKVKQTLVPVLNQAIKDGIIIKNPFTPDVALPPRSSKKVFALTEEEQKKVESVAFEYDSGDLIVFILYTGLRLNEAVSLKWEDIDISNNKISVKQSKTDSGLRFVPLSKMAKIILNHRKEEQGEQRSGYVFKNANGGPILHNARRLCLKIAKKAGIRDFSPHTCRHTFATRLLEKGANIKTVSELLGHASIQVTLDVYGHISQKLKQEAITLLDA